MTPLHVLLAGGVFAAVHAICTANCMSRRAPMSVCIEIVMMFGFAVGTVAACWNGDLGPASRFLLAALLAKVVAFIDMVWRGYPWRFSLVTCATFKYPDEGPPGSTT